MKQVVYFIFLFISLHTFAQYPPSVIKALKESGPNRNELIKVLQYFKRSNNRLKLQAAFFLIGNMDIHYSASYYWADSNNKKIAFDELSYPNFGSALNAFNIIKQHTPGIHPIQVRLTDVQNIKADFLIKNIELSFKAWQRSSMNRIPFKDFCEFILPYRTSVEPIQAWRMTYEKKFGWLSKAVKDKGLYIGLLYVSEDFNRWFTGTYGTEQRIEPLPRLGSLQLLFRKKGQCEDIADLTAFVLRSQGLPVALDEVPYWGTSSGSHFINSAFDSRMKMVPVNISGHTGINKKLGREPAKVIRRTFAKQYGLLAQKININSIPPGFMRTENYIDVTDQYWETESVVCPLFQNNANQILYACVLNGLRWCPTWWSYAKNNSAVFEKMSKGVVYVPCIFENGHIEPAGYPVAASYTKQQVLVPDYSNKINIRLTEQDRYLKFKPGRMYKLYYWDKVWKSFEQRKAIANLHEMIFNNVPSNALYLLRSDYSKKTERPFTINNQGVRKWW